MVNKISVIIPLAPKEKLHRELQEQILDFPSNWEILICSSQEPDWMLFPYRWIQTIGGRANSLNNGAREATGDYLWFLHADSILVDGTVDKLNEIASLNKEELYYFQLKFIKLSNHNVRPKEIGVKLRCQVFHNPFGDQGYFISKRLFEEQGPYNEQAEYGEDHLFVRKLRRNKFNITPIELPLYTSPRKYETIGWTNVTILHQYLWIKQAILDWRCLG